MKNYFVFAFIVILSFVSLAFQHQSANGNLTSSARRNSDGILALSHTEVFIPCKVGNVPTESCPDRRSITVAVLGTKHPDGEESEITHKVTGGRFFRKDKYFEWDFSDVEKPGEYTLTVEFTDYTGKKHTGTETITLERCDCPNDCFCPTLDVSANKTVKAGETVAFTVRVRDDAAKFYNWTITQGEIESGQGTSKIYVRTTPEMRGTIIATVEIDNEEFCGLCLKTASESSRIIE